MDESPCRDGGSQTKVGGVSTRPCTLGLQLVVLSVPSPALLGKVVLIAEDQFLLAEDIREAVLSAGATIVGPAATLERAMSLANHSRPDVAMFNLTLFGRSTLPLAQALKAPQRPLRSCKCVRLRSHSSSALLCAIPRAAILPRRPDADLV
jgi:hypothetical protein